MASEAASTSNTALAMGKLISSDLVRIQEEFGVTVHRTSQEILQASGSKHGIRSSPSWKPNEYSKRVMDSQREWVGKRVGYYELMNSPDLALAYEHYFPGRLKL